MSNWIYFDPPVERDLTFTGRRETKPDNTKDAIGKIARLIPGPVLGAYGAALGTLPLFSPDQQRWVGLLLYLLGIIGTGWIVGWQIGPGIEKRRHQAVYVAAFAVWAYSLTGNTALTWFYHPGVAALLPIIASVVFYNVPLPREKQKRGQ